MLLMNLLFLLRVLSLPRSLSLSTFEHCQYAFDPCQINSGMAVYKDAPGFVQVIESLAIERFLLGRVCNWYTVIAACCGGSASLCQDHSVIMERSGIIQAQFAFTKGVDGLLEIVVCLLIVLLSRQDAS